MFISQRGGNAFLRAEKGATLLLQGGYVEDAQDGNAPNDEYAAMVQAEWDAAASAAEKLDGDVIAKGAFAKSLERWAPLYEQGKRIPLLYGHNMDDPFYNIGTVTLAKEDDYGLYVEAEFDPENETAQYVRKLVQEGRLYQFSFAFSIDAEREVELDDGRKANELQELDIYEVSLVQIPANQTAVVTEVKAAEVMQGIADDIKSGRRNSAKDAKELERIGELASEIQKTVNGLLKSDDAEAADGEPKGASDGQAEIVAAYKEAILAYLKG